MEFHVSSREEESQNQISVQELAEILRGVCPPRLIDVRDADEQAIAHIEGFLPATQELMQEMIATWAKDTPIVTVCHHGIRSLAAANGLIEQGFTNVRSLQGGIDAWATQIDPSMARY